MVVIRTDSLVLHSGITLVGLGGLIGIKSRLAACVAKSLFTELSITPAFQMS